MLCHIINLDILDENNCYSPIFSLLIWRWFENSRLYLIFFRYWKYLLDSFYQNLHTLELLVVKLLIHRLL
jgi:hypothetical protein